MTPWLEALLFGLITATIIAGWVGLIIPIFPGLNIIWLATLVWGLVNGFAFPGWLIFALISILMVIGNWADNIFISGKARLSGASWWSILAGNIAAIFGAIVLPPLGGILFAVLGVFIVEFIRDKDWRKALITSKEMMWGFGWAIGARLAIGGLMALLWIIWVLFLF